MHVKEDEVRSSDWSSDVFSSDLRDRLYSHLVVLEQAFCERSSSGELVSRLTADTELLRSVVGSTISVALRSVVMVIGSLAMLVATSPRLAAYTLVGIPLCVLPLVIGGRKLGRISRQSQDRVADTHPLAASSDDSRVRNGGVSTGKSRG